MSWTYVLILLAGMCLSGCSTTMGSFVEYSEKPYTESSRTGDLLRGIPDLDQEKIISIYKDQFRQKIYDLNYDSLVTNPDKEIKSLINWLGWEWNESYLSPHLNERAVYTASDIQVRSPISSKSIKGWKNYEQLLQPAIEMLAQTEKYRDLL